MARNAASELEGLAREKKLEVLVDSTVPEMRVDCDQDVLWLRVQQVVAGACHTGRRSCFYRVIVRNGADAPLTLVFRDDERVFDPAKVYK